MIERKCKNCRHYTDGIPDSLQKFVESNYGRYVDGICHLYFPRGYLARKPPHPVRSIGGCFQFEPRGEIEGQEKIE